jgi:hypothetical protein
MASIGSVGSSTPVVYASAMSTLSITVLGPNKCLQCRAVAGAVSGRRSFGFLQCRGLLHFRAVGGWLLAVDARRVLCLSVFRKCIRSRFVPVCWLVGTKTKRVFGSTFKRGLASKTPRSVRQQKYEEVSLVACDRRLDGWGGAPQPDPPKQKQNTPKEGLTKIRNGSPQTIRIQRNNSNTTEETKI